MWCPVRVTSAHTRCQRVMRVCVCCGVPIITAAHLPVILDGQLSKRIANEGTAQRRTAVDYQDVPVTRTLQGLAHQSIALVTLDGRCRPAKCLHTTV